MSTAITNLTFLLPAILAIYWLFREDTTERIWDKKAAVTTYEHDFH